MPGPLSLMFSYTITYDIPFEVRTFVFSLVTFLVCFASSAESVVSSSVILGV